MNILHVVPSLSGRTGGPAHAVFGLSAALRDAGHEVAVYEPEKAFLRTFGYSGALRTRLEKTIVSFDVVHIHGLWTYSTYVASRLCQKRKIPYLIRPCGMLDDYSLSHHAFRKRIYSWAIEKKTIRGASGIHFTTSEELERSRRFGLSVPAYVLPLGLKLEEPSQKHLRHQFRQKNWRLQDQKIILFLGRITQKKGLELLLHAFFKIAQQHSAAHLIIAGPDDEGYGQKIRRLVRKLNLDSRVSIRGYVEGIEKQELLQGCDVFCLPSKQENFGLSVLEALAARLPVVVSDQVNLRSEILNSNSGLVTPLASSCIREALERLLSDEATRKKMGENGRRLVEEKFQWSRVVKEIIACYEQISCSKKGVQAKNVQREEVRMS